MVPYEFQDSLFPVTVKNEMGALIGIALNQ